MKRHAAGLVLCAALATAGVAAAPASAQTFQSYHCDDGAHFVVAFYDRDSRAYLQLDGRSVTLPKRLTWSGSRYSGDGVTLAVTKGGITLRHARRPTTACAADITPQ